jgi:proteasome lid subunit RPN8/RPN11
MISISQEVLDQIIDHAKKELPNEACGYLAGSDGIITKAYQLTNIDHSPEHFSFDPAEQFNAVKEARKNGLQIIANYHSHPSTPSRPSVEDIRLAYDPDISYVIISLAENVPVVKSFRILEGVAANEEIKIID